MLSVYEFLILLCWGGNVGGCKIISSHRDVQCEIVFCLLVARGCGSRSLLAHLDLETFKSELPPPLKKSPEGEGGWVGKWKWISGIICKTEVKEG